MDPPPTLENLKIREILDCLETPWSKIPSLWEGAMQIANHRDITEARLQVFEQEILIVNMLMWEWLDSLVHGACKAQLSGPPSQIALLVSRCQAILEIQSRLDIKLDAATYLKGFECGQKVYTVKGRTNKRYAVGAADTIDLVTSILVDWLEFPKPSIHRPRALLVRHLIDSVGPDILLLRLTRSACNRIRSEVFSNNVRRVPNQDDFNKWVCSDLAAHPISCENSAERQILSKIGDAYYDVFNYDRQRITHFSSVLPCVSLQNSPQQSLQDQRDTEIDRDEEPQPESVFGTLMDQLETLYPILDNPDLPFSVPNNTPRSSAAYKRAIWVEDIRLNDKKLPFRDIAPSRRRILGNGGPFSSENLSTRAGLFSAIIHRAVTHNTAFLQEQKTMFTSFEDFDSLYRSLVSTHPKTYFCNQSAYGSWTNRSVDYVKQYWNATGRNELTYWLNSTTKASFTAVYKIFLDGKIDGDSAFPAVGPLVAYLLTADYALAGKIHLPSSEEMGRIIYEIKAGGLKGLSTLGYACGNEMEVTDAFQDIYKRLQDRIPLDRQQQIGFSAIFVEHTMCKVSRMNTLKWRNIYGKKGGKGTATVGKGGGE